MACRAPSVRAVSGAEGKGWWWRRRVYRWVEAGLELFHVALVRAIHVILQHGPDRRLVLRRAGLGRGRRCTGGRRGREVGEDVAQSLNHRRRLCLCSFEQHTASRCPAGFASRPASAALSWLCWAPPELGCPAGESHRAEFGVPRR